MIGTLLYYRAAEKIIGSSFFTGTTAALIRASLEQRGPKSIYSSKQQQHKDTRTRCPYDGAVIARVDALRTLN
jgi:hypothetical protein